MLLLRYHCFFRTEQNRTEQNVRLFRHSAYIAHSPNTNTAWKRKEKIRKTTQSQK